MANYVFGIDVGGTSVKCGLFQTDGTLLEKWEIPTRTENGGSEILPDIAKSVKAKMGEKGIAADDVAGVGIDVPGPVNDKGELSIAVNLNWGYKNIVKELSNELGGMAVKAANDANAAALGEMWAGGGKGSKNLVMVTLGTGVGGGVSKAGQILIDGVAKYYREAAFIACKDTPIVLASLGNDAGIYGAAKMLID